MRGKKTNVFIFFFLLTTMLFGLGEGKVFETSEDGTTIVEKSTLLRRNYFGGISLFKDKPIAATVYANSRLECLKMNKESFKTAIEPIIHTLEESANKFNSFINSTV
jgi:CRP-like cAMP-binding protein